jgi:RimJ/RimL family protein N-acetyltransferase
MRPAGIIDAPRIVLDDEYVLNGWRPEDATTHRSFALDPDAARFFGWTVEEARAAPDPRYEHAIRRFHAEWQDGTRYSLAIRRLSDGEAVGSVELRPAGEAADASYMVVADLRGRGLAGRALSAMLTWGARELGVSQATLSCHIDNTASRRVAEKCGFGAVSRRGDELHFRRAVP